MFTPEELAQIRVALWEGSSPEELATRFGLSLTGLRMRLANSGYRIRVRRELEAVERIEVAATPEPVSA